VATKQSLADSLRGRGHKLTRQRRLVLEILDAAQEHLDAETLYARARERDPQICLATVYRSLSLFKDAGLVDQLLLGANRGHFETVQKEPHYHFQCLECGKVVEFQAPKAVEVLLKQFEEERLNITGIHIRLEGRCPDCCLKQRLSG
jgi:Fur family transcriptional regulator, ferric uptake regulator